ncbi:MAG: hypothetical protein H6551_05015 [Chitinophagales bacterium]|nr:hypothetical protein [Chitinophagaceae bacterium]MCB9064488.1 hypothetical protein [Chitinophagales bacterium]
MRYLVLILSVMIVAIGCQKLEAPNTPEEMLRVVDWVVDTGWVRTIKKADGVTVTADVDQTAAYVKPDCVKDDKFIFRENHEGARNTGELPCSINETTELQFTWGITNGGKNMYIYDAKEFFKTDVNAELLELYDDRFTIRYMETEDKATNGGDPNAIKKWVTDTTIYTYQFKAL